MTQTFWLGALLTRRELSARYRGTALGVLWPFLYSGLLLTMFTLVFSFILKVRWSLGADARPSEGALMIFAGLVPYLFLAEVLTRSITCITAVPNFVKKVRFPLLLLPVVVVSSAAVLAIVNTLILLGAVLVLWHEFFTTALLLPLLFVPLTFLGFGLALFCSTLGVFFRDLAQASPLIAQLLMFLAPVCYPMSIVPPIFVGAIRLNPLTWFVNTFRDLVLDGRFFSLAQWGLQTALCLAFALFGLFFFNRTRRSFADLL
jgi:lipopolysaccharide transport system permease protein